MSEADHKYKFGTNKTYSDAWEEFEKRRKRKRKRRARKQRAEVKRGTNVQQSDG